MYQICKYNVINQVTKFKLDVVGTDTPKGNMERSINVGSGAVI